jgi:hypothetical protein
MIRNRTRKSSSNQLTDKARADDIFVGLDRLRAAFQHSATSVE